MALIEKLEAIGDAIRAKTGGTELLTLDAMPAEIESIETGGGGGDIPEEAFVITGNCEQRFSKDGWNWFIESYGNKIITKDITQIYHMFSDSKTLKSIPFDINLKSNNSNANSPMTADAVFLNCFELEAIPNLNTVVYTSGIGSTFRGCKKIKEIPQSWIDNYKLDYINQQGYPSVSATFQDCHSLRSVPEAFVKQLRGKDEFTSSSGSVLYSGFNNCYSIDEIRGLPTVGKVSSNMFSGVVDYCHRVKEITFDTNEDGTPKTAQWKGQTFDLSRQVGYTDVPSRLTAIGFTIDTCPNGQEEYQLLKDNPDYWTSSIPLSRYNHDSAVNTINSLPDTSAYLAANGGTNTIKFRGLNGNATDGGAINTLTEEEIAVATAKGWTVSLV